MTTNAFVQQWRKAKAAEIAQLVDRNAGGFFRQALERAAIAGMEAEDLRLGQEANKSSGN